MLIIMHYALLIMHYYYASAKISLYNEEFDPGSGCTLATGLTHASRGAA